jgi:D-serine/D-alanine/glycine transporter
MKVGIPREVENHEYQVATTPSGVHEPVRNGPEVLVETEISGATATGTAARGHSEEPHLARSLSNRHIQMLAIGGAIGTGLFMGSGKTISLAGPAILFVYMIIGFMLFFVMRAMGEILLSNLNYKSFSDFAGDLMGPWAGFFTAWSYWFYWVVVGVADIVAISGYVRVLAPGTPLWIPALLTPLVLLGLNLPSVKAFGELEFWFAIIKVVAIVGLIATGAVMIATHFTSPDGAVASLANIWKDGGMFPHGLFGFILGFQIAIFAFGGIELVGTAAAETKNPEKSMPRAINSIPIRVLLFYVGALTVIMAVNPWRTINAGGSPFIGMFTLAGLGIAAVVVNLVVLTSATSSANSGIYSTSRMIYGLANHGNAPKAFGKLSSRRVPQNALLFSCMFLMAGLVMLYAGDSVMGAFVVVTSVASVLIIFTWSMIMVSYIVFRRRRPQLHAQSSFKMPGSQVMPYVVLAFFVFVLVALAQADDTRLGLYVVPAWFLALGAAWYVNRKTPLQQARIAEWKAMSTDEKAALTRSNHEQAALTG